MIQKKEIKKLYPDTRKEVRDYMYNVLLYLENEHGEVKPEWKAVLSMLAENLETYQKCKERIKADGVMIKDRYGNFNKHPLFPIVNSLQVQILKCVGELGLSPKAAQKMKGNESEDNTEDFLDSLLA